jgi:hypothetical protein
MIKTFFTAVPKWIYWVAMLIIVAAALIIFYIFWTLWFPPSTFSTDQPYKITTVVVAQGTKVGYQAKFCARKEQRFMSERQLLNVDSGILWDVPDLIVYLPIGCITQNLTADTPSEAPAGRYKIIERISVKINSIQNEEYSHESEPFNITQRGMIR